MKLFREGYEICKINPDLAEAVLLEVRDQKYVKSQDYRGDQGIAPLIAQWDHDHDREITRAMNSPPYFQSLWNQIATANFGWIQSNYGPFTQGSVLINKYPKGHSMRWHSDTLDATYIQTLLYVTGDNFEESDGGALELARCSVSTFGVYDKGHLDLQGTVLPNHGIMVNILNTDPTLLHRVTRVESNKERYTVVLRFGYLENTFTVKKWKTIKGL